MGKEKRDTPTGGVNRTQAALAPQPSRDTGPADSPPGPHRASGLRPVHEAGAASLTWGGFIPVQGHQPTGGRVVRDTPPRPRTLYHTRGNNARASILSPENYAEGSMPLLWAILYV
jgi:hypothetical protein